MPTPTKGPRLGGGPAHERLLLANLATALFEHDRISTTEAKAKRLRPLAERLITIAKKGDLHARRQLQTVIRDKDVVHKLLAEIGPANATRPGGYTRIVKTNPRKGDNAPMAIIELVGELQSVVAEAEKARGTRTAAKKAPTGRTREIAEDAAAESATAAAVANSDSEPESQSDDAAPEEGLESIGLSGDEAEEAAEASEQVLGGEPEAGGFETTADDAGEAGAPPEAESDANAEPEK